jgi:hypothetical protein
MPKIYKREKYVLNEYKDEQYMMEITNEEKHISTTKFSNKWEILYEEAKREAEKGNHVSIWDLRWELKP